MAGDNNVQDNGWGQITSTINSLSQDAATIVKAFQKPVINPAVPPVISNPVAPAPVAGFALSATDKKYMLYGGLAFGGVLILLIAVAAVKK